MEQNTEQLIYHHTALLVTSIREAAEEYAAVFGQAQVSDIFTVSTQKVQVCFVQNGPNSYIELVAPLSDDSPVMQLLRKKHSYYHLGYKVQNIQRCVAQLEKLNYKALSYYSSEAFGGNTCIFMFTPSGHLIELIAY